MGVIARAPHADVLAAGTIVAALAILAAAASSGLVYRGGCPAGARSDPVCDVASNALAVDSLVGLIP